MALLLIAGTALGQTLRSVMVDENRFVTKTPTISHTYVMSFGDNLGTSENLGGAVFNSNNAIYLSAAGTNTASQAGIRFAEQGYNQPAGGVGTLFGSETISLYTVVNTVVPRTTVIRVVLGNHYLNTTNIGVAPTNRAIGYEIIQQSQTNNQVQLRLIAHNGTSLTNGPYVYIGEYFSRFTIGVVPNRTNGEVKLFVAVGSVAPTNIPAATIMGGPTNNAPINHGSFEAGIDTVTTNAQGGNVNIIKAWLEATP